MTVFEHCCKVLHLVSRSMWREIFRKLLILG